MKKNKIIFDMFIAILGIVLILGTARGINLSKKTNEAKSKELRAGITAPGTLNLDFRSFAKQDDNRLVIPHSQGYITNKQFDYTVEGEQNNTITYFPLLYVSTNGEHQNEVVYCVDVTKSVPSRSNEYKPKKATAALSYLAKTNQVGNQDTLDVDTELDYFARQVAVYSVLNQTGKDTAYENLNTSYRATMKTKVDALVSAAQQATFDVELTSTGDKTLTKVDGENYYESGLITVSGNQKDPKITFRTSNNNVTILDSNNRELTGEINSGTKIKVRIPESQITTETSNIQITADVNATIEQGYIYETTATEGNQPILYPRVFEEPATGEGQIVFAVNKENPKYSITISKVDGQDQPLAGARLIVKEQGTNRIVKDEYISTTNSVTINDLDEGDYYIEEIEPPTGYEKISNITFSLPANDGQTIKVRNNKVPDQKGNLTINKVDASGIGVAGATIILKDSSNQEVGRFTTTAGNTSHTFTDLAIGSYTIVELEPPVGYRKSDNISVNVVNGQTITENVVNQKTSITIIKHNENDQPLAGAVLEVIDSEGTVVNSWTTDATGSYTIDGIPIGTYKLREKTAPNGYAKSDQEINFTIQHTSETADIIFKNYKNIVKIYKVDADTDKLIGGANLVIKDSNNKMVKSFMTDGTIYELNGLNAGTYTIEETQAPDGYAKITDKISFTVKADSTEVVVKVPNEKLVIVPSTSSAASTILFVLGFLFITCGGAFIYYYVKTPQNL